MLMGTMDTLMLSNYSDYAVGAVGNSNTLINMFAVLLLIVANGVAVLVSQYLGAKKEHVATRIIGNGLIVNFFVGLILSITIISLAPMILHLVNTEAVLFSGSMDYLQVVGGSLLFVAVSNIATASLRSYNRAKYITYVVVVANILNILGNFVLIYGYLGFPSLGVLGAGISTLIVRIMMMITYLFLLRKIIGIRILKSRLYRDTTRQILKIGLPSALESWTYTLMQGVVLSMINRLGSDFTTARTYINTILTYIYIFSLAFASANAVMTGYYIGQRDYIKAHEGSIKTAIRSFFIVLFMTLFVNFFSGSIMSLFSDNQLIVQTVRTVLWLAIILEFSRSLNLIFIQALRSAGDATFPLVMAIISMLGIAIPSAYLFGIVLGLGLFGIYMAYALDELIRAIFMVIRWQSRKWEAKSSYLENTQ
jgi:putative MATE family efflux protein